MGSSPSIQQNHDFVEHHPQYPDMNAIFRGIPKMLQVADDLHRMTNYIMDLRNMNIVLVIITVVGICGFLLLRIVNGRSSQKRRQRTLIRNPEEVVPSGYYFHSQSTSEPWKRMKTSSNQRDEMEENDFFDIPPDMTESGPNGSVSYKYRDREDLFRPYMKKGTKAPLEIPEKSNTASECPDQSLASVYSGPRIYTSLSRSCRTSTPEPQFVVSITDQNI